MNWHHMIDLETIDTSPTAGILSIGIVAFNPDTGEVGPSLYRRLGYDQALQFGTQSASTIEWQQKQSEAARTEAFTGQHDATIAAFEVSEFIATTAGVWGNGATFDITITEHWLNATGVGVPYKPWVVCDCRTVEQLAKRIGILRKQFNRAGVHHNALDDAIYQAHYISAMWQGLTKRPVVQLPEPEDVSRTFGFAQTPMYIAEELHTALSAVGVTYKQHCPHQFIETGDADAFPAIMDSHGDVVLAYCRICKQAEGDLALSCPGAPTA